MVCSCFGYFFFFILLLSLFLSDTHTQTNAPSAISLQQSSQLCVIAQLRSTFVLVFCMVTSIASVCTKHRGIEVFFDLAWLRQLLFSLVPVSFNLAHNNKVHIAISLLLCPCARVILSSKQPPVPCFFQLPPSVLSRAPNSLRAVSWLV